MRLVVEAFDGCVLDGAVHAFDLAVGPRLAWLGQPMFDVVLGAGNIEGVREKHLATIHRAANVWGRRSDVSRRGKMGAVVGQDGMDPVPRAYIEMILSSKPVKRRWYFAISSGSKLPCRSRGISKAMRPLSVTTFFRT